MKTQYCICIFYYADLFVKEHKNSTNTAYLSEQGLQSVFLIHKPDSPTARLRTGSLQTLESPDRADLTEKCFEKPD